VWSFENKVFEPTPEYLEPWVGFVYEITDLVNDKKYIGKKLFWSVKKLPPLKGKKRKRIKRVQSDWMNYYGSNEKVKLLVENEGSSRFKRDIIRLCKSKGVMSYFEAKEQFDKEVLLSDKYYNEFIGMKIHSKHVRGKI
tara:strand:- start:105 stop:521 length:417 start_codon:yes stop_codon:yes gene_type:complete